MAPSVEFPLVAVECGIRLVEEGPSGTCDADVWQEASDVGEWLE